MSFMKLIGLVFVMVFTLLFLRMGHAATFTNNGNVIFLEGEIKKNDAVKLESMVTATGLKTVFLNSDGGDALEGYDLGYTIQDLGLSVVIASETACLSSCAIAFMGGKTKIQGGILGYHVAWSPDDTQSYSDGMKSGQFIGALNAAYFFNMGYTAQLPFIVSHVTTPDTFLILSSDDLKLFKIEDGAYTSYSKLPRGWVADRIAGSLRLFLLKKGI